MLKFDFKFMFIEPLTYMIRSLKLNLFSVFSLILFLGFSSVDIVNDPSIQLNGTTPHIIEVLSGYSEPGATADDIEK